MQRAFFLLFFNLFGWKINGSMPDIKKYIIAVAPHTSNWDFLVGVAARSVLRINNAKYLGKSSLFKPPFGWFFRMTGGIPVDRDGNHNMVEQVALIARNSDEFMLGMAPEGTRKKVSTLKTGFWYIAKAAGIPIVPVGFDYRLKEVVIGAPVYPANLETDIDQLSGFYRKIHGKNPELGL